MLINATETVAGAIAAWRITHLFQAEDGPWDLLAHLRRMAGDGVAGRMLDCFYCLSVWVALPLAMGMGATYKERLLLWPVLSGGAILLERATTRQGHTAPLAQWRELPDADAPDGEGS